MCVYVCVCVCMYMYGWNVLQVHRCVRVCGPVTVLVSPFPLREYPGVGGRQATAVHAAEAIGALVRRGGGVVAFVPRLAGAACTSSAPAEACETDPECFPRRGWDGIVYLRPAVLQDGTTGHFDLPHEHYVAGRIGHGERSRLQFLFN